MDSEREALVSTNDICGTSIEAHAQYGTLVQTEINGKWTALWQRTFPTGFIYEVREIFKLAWPMYVTDLLTTATVPISVIFSGHLGTDELAAVAMATSFINLSGMVVVQGLRLACDTLFPQAFGGKNKKTLGVYLQRGLLIMALSCLPCWAIQLNTRQLLIAMGQDPKVAKLTGEYLLIFLPGLLFYIEQQVLARYLQTQGILKPLILIGLMSNGLNILLQYLLVYVAHLSIYGSAMSQTISYLATLVLTVLYILLWKKYAATWPGWTWRCLENWGIFMNLAISGLFLSILYWGSYEIGTLLSGLLGTVELGATSTVMQIQSILFLTSLNVGVAVSIRVGYNLGAGSADGAKTASHVAFVLSLLAFAVQAVLTLSLMYVIPYIFTSDASVAELASSMIPIACLGIMFCSITTVSMCVLEGAGRQLIGAIVNVFCYPCIGLAMGAVLMFVVKIGPAGFWWGSAMAECAGAIIYLPVIARMNWKREVDKVSTRILPTDMVLSIEGTDDDISQTSSLLGMRVPAGNSHTNGVVLHNGTRPPHLADEEDDDICGDNVTAVPESLSYLICKRVASVIILLMILVAGILTRIFIPVPEESFSNTTLTNITDHVTTIDTIIEL